VRRHLLRVLDVALEVGRVWGEQVWENSAKIAARFGAERHAANTSWPYGPGLAHSPSLMQGLAGIGYFYLRLDAPGVPSILAPEPNALARA